MRRFSTIIKVVGALLLALLVGLYIPLPNPIFTDPYSTVLIDKDGKLLGARIANDGQWRFPKATATPCKFEQALVSFEDQYFYYHLGVNPVSITRAVMQNLKARKIVSGGSTLTMQVARMMYKNQPRTILQKLKEVCTAIRLEAQYSKKEILELYISHAPFGGNVVGLGAASWRYYGRDPSELSWAEYANLAVLPNAPSLIFPGKNDAELIVKRNRLLEKLYAKGLISESELSLGQLEPIPNKPKPLPNYAPHLLDRAINDGLVQTTVKSSINKELQKAVTSLVSQYHKNFRDRQINNAAALVIDIETGKSLAYIGNVGDEQIHANDVDIINSKRSPGSLLKPFLYAMAIDEGFITPWELLPDIPLYYRGFAPKNFDKKYAGAVKANLALRSSLNVPFVHLLKDYGYENFHHKLKNMGVYSLDLGPGHYGLTLILGGGEVTMWEMAALYAGLVRTASDNTIQGYRWQPNAYLNEAKSKISIDETRISAAAAYHTLKAMQELRRPDQESNWQRFGSSRPIAWKTGTSYGHKDAWSIGVNNKYVVAVWLGNADGEGRSDLVGVTAASPLMFKIFGLLDGDANFIPPTREMALAKICLASGQKANEYCTEVATTYVSTTINITGICSYHQLIHLDKSMQYRVNSKCYPVSEMVSSPWFVMPPAQAWYYKKANLDYTELPEFISDCSDNENMMEMIYPRQFAKVYVPIELDRAKGRVVFEVAHQNPESTIYWHIDNEFIGLTKSDHHLGLYPSSGKHLLSLIDEQGRELKIPFEVLNDG